VTRDEWNSNVVIAKEEMRSILEKKFGKDIDNFWTRSDILISLIVQQLLQLGKDLDRQVHFTEVEKYMHILTLIAKTPFLPDFSPEFCVDLKALKREIFQ
jgi:hypothetical protein